MHESTASSLLQPVGAGTRMPEAGSYWAGAQSDSPTVRTKCNFGGADVVGAALGQSVPWSGEAQFPRGWRDP